MIDALRGFLNRPLADADRPRVFVAAVAVILAGAAAFGFLADRAPRRVTPHRTVQPSPSPSAAAPLPTVATAPATAPTRKLPSEEGRPSASATGSPADVEGARGAARRFLADYLPYSYGRRSARRIARATPGLRRRLAADRPRVPARERRRRARVVLVHADGVSHARAALTALVDDGATHYTVAVALERRDGRWTVTDVGG